MTLYESQLKRDKEEFDTWMESINLWTRMKDQREELAQRGIDITDESKRVMDSIKFQISKGPGYQRKIQEEITKIDIFI